MDFLYRNEGDFIGAIAGILIAIVASFLTFYLAKSNDFQKERNNYQGNLYSLYVELDWHKNHFKLLNKTLFKLKTASLQNGYFILKSTPMQFDLSITENSLNRITGFKGYNHEIIGMLISYINQLKSINYLLDFNKANELIFNKNIKQNIERISKYFEVLDTQYISITQSAISKIRILIETELKDYPQERLIFKEEK